MPILTCTQCNNDYFTGFYKQGTLCPKCERAAAPIAMIDDCLCDECDAHTAAQPAPLPSTNNLHLQCVDMLEGFFQRNQVRTPEQMKKLLTIMIQSCALTLCLQDGADTLELVYHVPKFNAGA